MQHSVRPSDPAADDHRIRTSESAVQRTRALYRGTLVHRLLQSLPDVATERRRDAALAYLARNTDDDWTDPERQALADGVLSLIADLRFAPVFAAGSRAEVSIVGRLAGPQGEPVSVSGQVDRLVVTPSEVLIVDFKTNHAPPRVAVEAPGATFASLRCTGPCWPGFIRICPSAPRCSGPKRLN